MTRIAYQILAAQEFQPGGNPPSEIELLQVGDWNTPWHGHIKNTVDDFNAMVNNFANGAGKFQPDNKLPINIDHYKDQAVGWIHGLEVRGNSLWGTGIEWTSEGKQLLADKAYSYLSSEWSPVWQNPLDDEELVDNVFTGACVTNYPLFSNLQPLTASNKQKKELTASSKPITLYMKGSVMNLKDLLAKDAADLTDDEKAFIVENKADLTDEQVTTLTEAGVLEAESEGSGDEGSEDGEGDDEGTEDEGSGDEDDGSGQQASRKKGDVSISASKLRKLEADAARGVEADRKLRDNEATAKTNAMIITANNKSGHFVEANKTKLKSFYVSLNASQKTAFEQLVAGLPQLPLGQRASVSDTGKGAGAVAELDSKIAEAMEASHKDGKTKTYMQARADILKKDKDLKARVDAEQIEERE